MPWFFRCVTRAEKDWQSSGHECEDNLFGRPSRNLKAKNWNIIAENQSQEVENQTADIHPSCVRVHMLTIEDLKFLEERSSFMDCKMQGQPKPSCVPPFTWGPLICVCCVDFSMTTAWIGSLLERRSILFVLIKGYFGLQCSSSSLSLLQIFWPVLSAYLLCSVSVIFDLFIHCCCITSIFTALYCHILFRRRPLVVWWTARVQN